MEVPIWLERAFCESGRKAGQEIDFATILETREPVTAGDGPHLVQVEDDGQVKVVGTNRGTIPGMSRSQVDVAERVMGSQGTQCRQPKQPDIALLPSSNQGHSDSGFGVHITRASSSATAGSGS